MASSVSSSVSAVCVQNCSSRPSATRSHTSVTKAAKFGCRSRLLGMKSGRVRKGPSAKTWRNRVEFRLTEPHTGSMKRQPALLLMACVLWAAFVGPAMADDAVFPIASRLGLVPFAGLKPSNAFPGFEDATNNVFVRLVALPGPAFGEIEKTMTNDALK